MAIYADFFGSLLDGQKLYQDQLAETRRQRAMDLEYVLSVMQPGINTERQNREFAQRLDELELQSTLAMGRDRASVAAAQAAAETAQQYAIDRAAVDAVFNGQITGPGVVDILRRSGIAPNNAGLMRVDPLTGQPVPLGVGQSGAPPTAALTPPPVKATVLPPVSAPATAPAPAAHPTAGPGAPMQVPAQPAASTQVPYGPAVTAPGYAQPSMPAAPQSDPVVTVIDALTGEQRTMTTAEPSWWGRVNGGRQTMRTPTQADLARWLYPGALPAETAKELATNPGAFYTDGVGLYRRTQ